MTIDDEDTSEHAGETPTEKRKVGIAEYAVTTSGGVLTTNLGSCIGVALYDGAADVAGLVHVMLPTAENNEGDPAKFADTGVDVLAEAMEDRGADRTRLTAKVAGGSDMLDFSQHGSSIGVRNVRTVRETLQNHSIPIEGEDVGGDYARSLEFQAETGALIVTSADRNATTL